MTDPIKAKIIELCGGTFTDARGISYSPQLHDVLRAIAGHPAKFVMWPDGDTFEEVGPHLVMRLKDDDSDEGIASWNLTADFDGQDDDVKLFIGKLIGV